MALAGVTLGADAHVDASVAPSSAGSASRLRLLFASTSAFKGTFETSTPSSSLASIAEIYLDLPRTVAVAIPSVTCAENPWNLMPRREVTELLTLSSARSDPADEAACATLLCMHALRAA